MNELMELINAYPVLDNMKTWLMEMSLWNLVGLGLTLVLAWSIELSVSINKVENKRPKYLVVLISIILMIMYPYNMLFAMSPFLVIIWLLATWESPVYWYLNLFLPVGLKLKY